MKVSNFETYLEEAGETYDEFVADNQRASHGYVENEKWVHVEHRHTLRERLRAQFPHLLIVEGYDMELDKAARWAWEKFGPADGMCWSYGSEFPTCKEEKPHSHSGVWAVFGLGKTDYDYFFEEIYFKNEADLKEFAAHVPTVEITAEDVG